MSFQWLWRFASRQAGPRDGQGLSLDALEIGQGTVPPPPVTQGAWRRDSVEATLALKMLSAHLANFRQVSFPLTLDFRSLNEADAALLVDAAGAALEAAGPDAEDRRETASEALRRLGASGPQLAPLLARVVPARSVGNMADEARRLDKAAHVYAVSLVVLGSRSALAQAYLGYLGARLGLTRNVIGSLNRRYRA